MLPIHAGHAGKAHLNQKLNEDIKEITSLPTAEQATKIEDKFKPVNEKINRLLSISFSQICLKKEFHSKYPFYSVSFSPDGKTVCGLAKSTTKGQKCCTKVKLWNTDGLEKIAKTKIIGKKDFVQPLIYADNHHLLWDAGHNKLYHWGIATKKLTPIKLEEKKELQKNKRISFGTFVDILDNLPFKDLDQVVFSKDGKYFAACTVGENPRDREIHVWSIETGKRINSFDTKRQTAYCNHCLIEGSFSLNADGSLLAYASAYGITIWDVNTGKELVHNDQSAYGLLFSPDGKILSFESPDNFIRILDIETGTITREIPLHNSRGILSNNMCSRVFSPDGKMLVCGFENGQVKFISIDTGEEVLSFQTINLVFKSTDWSKHTLREIAFSSDGKYLATCAKSYIKLWDMDKVYKMKDALENSYNHLTPAQKMLLCVLYYQSNEGKSSKSIHLDTLSQALTKQYGERVFFNLVESYNSFDPVLKEIVQASFHII